MDILDLQQALNTRGDIIEYVHINGLDNPYAHDLATLGVQAARQEYQQRQRHRRGKGRRPYHPEAEELH